MRRGFPASGENLENNPTATPSSTGLMYGISAYLVWGFFPIYFKALGSVPSLQIVCHRIVWSALFLAILITLRRGWSEVCAALSSRGTLLLLVTTALLIATNWLIFIVAVNHAEVLQSSLGYFMTPFVSVVLGVALLKERLRRLQAVAIVFALFGVALITAQQSGPPWAALTLAITFGTYGLLRKVAGVDALAGLAIETFILAPAAAGYLVYAELHGAGSFGHGGGGVDALLVCAGVVTASAAPAVRRRGAHAQAGHHRFPPVPHPDDAFPDRRGVVPRTVHGGEPGEFRLYLAGAAALFAECPEDGPIHRISWPAHVIGRPIP